jgi:protein-L-isoaspartate(D-aspartate) O-methyltransferase
VVGAEELNRELVRNLQASGNLRARAVEAAFLAVPRHLFLPTRDIAEVYRDEAIMTKQQDGMPVSSSSQPAIMAEMLEQLELQRGQSVLEIGTGTGYNAALLAHLAGPRGTVVSIDLDAELVAAARRHLKAAGYERVNVVKGDGGYGYPPASPYDRIIVTAGSADVPPAWLDQLKPGGRLVVPLLLRGGVQASAAFVARRDCLEAGSLICCGFMPLRGAFADVPHGLPLNETLTLLSDSPDALDKGTILTWLEQPRPPAALEIQVDARELWDRFRPWLALRERGHVVLVETEAAAGIRHFRYRSGLLTPAGLGLLDLDGDGPAVRAFGPFAIPAELMLRQIAVWDAAGRPGLERVRLRAYPLTRVLEIDEDDVVIQRPNTTLVISAARRA